MTGTLPSERLGIKGEVAALSVDLAIASRLFLLETESREMDAKRIAYEVSKIFAGTPEDDVLDADILRDDPYADKDTQVW